MNIDFIKSLENGGQDHVADILQDQEKKLQQTFRFPELTPELRQRLWTVLFRWLDGGPSPARHPALLLLRILTRDRDGLDSLMTSSRLQSLTTLAGLENLQSPRPELTEVEQALKCLCNLTHQSAAARRLLVDNPECLKGLSSRLHEFQHSERLSPSIRLFTLRLLFLLTTLCPETRLPLVKQHQGLGRLLEVLELLIRTDLAPDASDTQLTQGTELATEILKTLYSVCVSLDGGDEQQERQMSRLLREYLLLTGPAARLHVYTVQVLTALPAGSYSQLLVPESAESDAGAAPDTSALDAVLSLLTQQLQQPQRETMTPTLMLLCRASSGCPAIRRYMRATILPHRTDVLVRPEEGDSLKSHLVRLMTSPHTQVKELAAHFLFILCKEDVRRFVKYTGYGNAAGLLAARGLMTSGGLPSGHYSSDSDSDTEEYSRYRQDMDPVTGRVEPHRPCPTDGMSEERKIHEAEKLVTLIQQSIDRGLIQPCRIGADGRPQPLSHVLELQEAPPPGQNTGDSDGEE